MGLRLVREQQDLQAGAAIAQVSYGESGGICAVGDSAHRELSLFAPRGISYRPCEGDNVLLLPVEGVDICAGVLCTGKGLEEGELRLTSSGGACIQLRGNGDVVINGLRITRSGEIMRDSETEG